MKFAIVLVIHDPYDNYTCKGILDEAIKSIAILQGTYSVIAVNNHELKLCPKTTKYLKNLAQNNQSFSLIETGRNLGCAGGFNTGARNTTATTETLIYMSPDALLIDKDLLKKISDGFQSHPSVGMIHPFSMYEDANDYNFARAYNANAFYKKAVYSDGTELTTTETEIDTALQTEAKSICRRNLRVKHPIWTVPLTFLAIRRDLFNLLQGFDEDFFAGGENTDFTFRALKNGFHAGLLMNSVVLHRRLLFKKLGSAGPDKALDHYGAQANLKAWRTKWGNEPNEVYLQLRYGQPIAKILTLSQKIGRILRAVVCHRKHDTPSTENIPLKRFFAYLYADFNYHRDYFKYCIGLADNTTPHILKRRTIQALAKQNDIKYFVETGTYMGDMLLAMHKHFKKLYSIEISPVLYKKASIRLRNKRNISLICGDSEDELKKVTQSLDDRAIFWLDAHYSGAGTGRGKKDTPIESEIRAILRNAKHQHIILIDDAKDFTGATDYPNIDRIRQLIINEDSHYYIQIRNNIIFVLPGPRTLAVGKSAT